MEGQKRLRELAGNLVAATWRQLPSHNREDIPQFLALALPIVVAAQRQSVAMTNAYLARSLDNQPVPLDVAKLIAAAVRAGTPPETVYTRPFITTWKGMKDGQDPQDAVHAGEVRAVGLVVTDVQLSQRATWGAVQRQVGYAGYVRVADPGACPYCAAVNGAFLTDGGVGPLHPGCGCTVEPTTDRPAREESLPEGVAVFDHGELGPTLIGAGQNFTDVHDLPVGTELGNGLRVGHGGVLTDAPVA